VAPVFLQKHLNSDKTEDQVEVVELMVVAYQPVHQVQGIHLPLVLLKEIMVELVFLRIQTVVVLVEAVELEQLDQTLVHQIAEQMVVLVE